MKAKVSYAGTSGATIRIDLFGDDGYILPWDESQKSWPVLLRQLQLGDNVPRDPVIGPISDSLDELLNGAK